MKNNNQRNPNICWDTAYDGSAIKYTPQNFERGGVDNAGKVMTVNEDGWIEPLPPEVVGGGVPIANFIEGEGIILTKDVANNKLTISTELEPIVDVYWSALRYSDSDSTTIVEYLTANYFTQDEVNYKINTLNTKIDNKVSDIVAGTNITVSKNPETHTYTISATGGGGSAEPVYVIVGTATITDPTSLVDIPITISSTNPFNELQTFFNTNNRLPRIIFNLTLQYAGETISNIYLDMFANTVDSSTISLAGYSNDLSSSGISVSYIDLKIKSSEQTGLLTATPLQTRLDSNSEFSARKINIGRYFVTESVMEALNHLLSGAVLLDTNQSISGTKTFTGSFGIKVSDTPNVETHYKNGNVEVAHIVTGKTDHFNFPNKDGGTYTLATTDDLPSTTKSYLHCIEVLDDNNNINFYLRFINHSNTTYTSWSQLISETKKMWGWGRTNQQASTYHRYDVTAIGDNGTVLFIDEENNTYDLEEVNVTSITDRGCIEL